MNYFTEIALVEKATADDETPTPGYIYGELIQILNKSPTSRDNLLEQLLNRLNKNSPAVKLKTLRVLKHLLMKADANFRRNMQRKSETFRPLIDYRGAIDPLRGEAPSRLIREEAKEVLNLLFSDEIKVESTAIEGGAYSQENSSSSSSSTSAFGFMTGGSNYTPSKSTFVSGGLMGGGIHNKTETFSPSGLKLEGFGNFDPPAPKEEGLIDKLMSRISNNPPTPTTYSTSSPGSLSNFGGLYTSPTAPTTSSSYANQSHTELSKGPEHVPGRPGGSWLQEPEQTVATSFHRARPPGSSSLVNNEESNHPVAVTSSPALSGSVKHDQRSSTGEVETRLVEEITLPGGIRAAPSKDQLTQFCARASSLDLVTISELLCERLSSQQWQSVLKALYAIEALLSAGHELYFSDKQPIITELIEQSQNSSIKEKAYGVLQVLRNEDQQMKKQAKPHKTIPKQVNYTSDGGHQLSSNIFPSSQTSPSPSPSPLPSTSTPASASASDMFAKLKVSSDVSENNTIDLLGFNDPEPVNPALVSKPSQSFSVDELLSFSSSSSQSTPAPAVSTSVLISSSSSSNGGGFIQSPPIGRTILSNSNSNSINNTMLISSSPKTSNMMIGTPVGYYHQQPVPGVYGVGPVYPVVYATPVGAVGYQPAAAAAAAAAVSSSSYVNPQKVSMYTTSVFSSPEITSQADRRPQDLSLKNTSFTFVHDEMKKSNKV